MADNMSQMAMLRVSRWWNGMKRRMRALQRRADEAGITYIEIAFMMLIVSILIVSLTNAIQVAAKGTLAAKERSRALSLARDRLEEVKNFGWRTVSARWSNYYYPEIADPNNPLHQSSRVAPYPIVPPSPADDPWTPEVILSGNTSYWRHVVVKFVQETSNGQALQQVPPQNPQPPCAPCTSPIDIGGYDPSGGLAYVEVDVTWFSRRTRKMEQVRVSTLVAQITSPSRNVGKITGTVFDDDSNNDLIDGGGNVPGVIPGPDDSPVVGVQLIVVARDTLTGATYQTFSRTWNGTYALENLPHGAYYLDVRGAPTHDDSGYANATGEPGLSTPMVPITLDLTTPNMYGAAIWTMRIKTATYKVRVKGIDGTVTPKTVVVSASDGLSVDTSTTVTWMCDSASPCLFTLTNVAWPSTGTAFYRVTVNNATDHTQVSATVYMNRSLASSSTSYFVIGDNPAVGTYLATGANNCCDCGPGCGYCTSEDLPPFTPLDCSISSVTTPATVRLKVEEYIGTGTPKQVAMPAGDIPSARVVMSAGGVSATLGFNLDGSTSFVSCVPVGVGQVNFKVYMTATGFDTDSYFLPFEVQPGNSYNLVPNEPPPPADPLDSQRHLFVIHRVATITGTIFDSAGQGKNGAKVTIVNVATQWNNTITAGSGLVGGAASGVFSHPGVPIESEVYTVKPVVDPDYIPVPSTRDVVVDSAGTVYSKDNSNSPMQFTLTAINGVILGTISDASGKRLSTGATVIASNYNSTTSMFVASIPSPLLSGKYTFSAMTLSDGTYRMKVATGVGDYFLYVAAVVNGVPKYVRVALATGKPGSNEEWPVNVTLP